VLLLDQSFKFWIKTNYMIGDSFPVLGDWFLIRFIENPGMAFGLTIDGNYGKLILSVFRIVAVIAIGFYLRYLVKQQASKGLVGSIALILAGALGNILDSAFYGLLFSDSTLEVARFLPEEGGYASFLHGNVVDMLYFPLIEGQYWDWIPKLGGQKFVFFRPIFNIADSSITVGVLLIFLFQRRFCSASPKTAAQPAEAVASEAAPDSEPTAPADPAE
ncbi:MAG: lipoprotein signal peptidase, partial [Bacteroidota bacterium]